LGLRDWISTGTNPILAGIVNVVFGLAGGLVRFVFDVVRIVIDAVSTVGHIVASVLRLDFAAVIAEILNPLILVGEILLAVVRLVTGG
jgi:hypothetical protein